MVHFEPGIFQQMEWENAAAAHLGFDWRARLFVASGANYPKSSTVVEAAEPKVGRGSGALARLKRWFEFRKAYYEWLSQEAKECDVLLLRYSLSDPLQLRFIKTVGVPVFTVHHTLELSELRGRGGFIAYLRAGMEAVFGSASLRAASGVVGVTNEIRLYEQARMGHSKPGLVYPNGIFKKGCCQDDRRGAVVNIVFVASSFLPWHGLDVLLSNLDSCKENFVLHLVGRVNESDRCVAERDQRVVLHGLLNSEEMSSVMAMCDVGLASFALHRNDMREACTLKVREYLSAGIPVYSGYRDVFPDEFPFYKMGEATFPEIMSFARKVRSIPRGAVAGAAAQYIEKDKLLAHFYDELRTVVTSLG